MSNRNLPDNTPLIRIHWNFAIEYQRWVLPCDLTRMITSLLKKTTAGKLGFLTGIDKNFCPLNFFLTLYSNSPPSRIWLASVQGASKYYPVTVTVIQNRTIQLIESDLALSSSRDSQDRFYSFPVL